jgi:hypothetical protein
VNFAILDNMQNSDQEEQVLNLPKAEQPECPAKTRIPIMTKLKSIKFLPKTWHKIAFGILVALGLIASSFLIITLKTVNELKFQAQESKLIAQQAYDAFKAQNLPESEVKAKALTEKLIEINTTYSQIKFYKYIPLIRNYYLDGEHGLKAAEHGLSAVNKALASIVPYADVLGFEGEDSFEGGTAEDRVKIIIETLDKIMPEFDAIVADLELAKAEFLKINPQRYPERIRNQELRSLLVNAQTSIDQGLSNFVKFRPVLQELPNIAGGKEERKKYIILFQNDNELRPTGGFLTAYAVIYIEDGKVTPEKSDDIYELDQKFRKKIAIPESLGRYLITEKYWHLRDMNISPDFKTSMDTFFENYQTVRGEPDNIDGIISVDTHVLTRLLEILGPVSIGSGTFTAEVDKRCDCPQVVYALSEIITKPTPYLREDRKGILGPLMQAILAKSYAAPKQMWPDLFGLLWESLEARHLQMYFTDENAQLASEAVNAAGRLTPVENQDFLAIVDANLGGAKSNLFTTMDVEQHISLPENNMMKKTVEITYKNSRKADNCNLEAGQLCLNSTLNDWHRLYLPLGSKLIEAQGFTQDPLEYEEAGFSVIDGFFKLEPNAVAKIKITYEVPYTNTETYRGYFWKQGGIDPVPHLIEVNGGEEEVLVDKDVEYEAKF